MVIGNRHGLTRRIHKVFESVENAVLIYSFSLRFLRLRRRVGTGISESRRITCTTHDDYKVRHSWAVGLLHVGWFLTSMTVGPVPPSLWSLTSGIDTGFSH